jgi:putative acyl-CoA dehydrogenase
MQNVLADLALESEAATVLAMRLARCFDQVHDPAQAMLARVLTPAAKYWICKRGPGLGAEAMEVIGGSGYVEESRWRGCTASCRSIRSGKVRAT